MSSCQYPGCGGVVESDGFCSRCGRKQPPTAPASGSGAAGEDAASCQYCGGVVESDGFCSRCGRKRSSPGGTVPEHERFCGGCRKPVGRGHHDQPGLTRGFCPHCGTPFRFEAKLRRGDRIGRGRYEIVDPFEHGGFGWVYRAKDIDLEGRPVAVKALIDTASSNARQRMLAEKRYLLRLSHSNVVGIVDYVTHPDPDTGGLDDYIVMEFVSGSTLAQVKREMRTGRHPMPVGKIIEYGLTILDALGYLHEQGYLYCDLKPDNVIETQDGTLKLIDLGAVRRIVDDESRPTVTPSYAPHKEEIQTRGFTVRSDLYTVGTTLEALFAGTEDDSRLSPARSAIEVGIRSFRDTLTRARDDWDQRFNSAAEMAEQLSRVRGEITALGGGQVPTEPSALFSPPGNLFDAGLGEVPSLERWTTEPASAAVALRGVPLTDGRPSPAMVAIWLPDPLIDPDDAAAATLKPVSASDPERLLEQLTELEQRKELADSVEIALWRCRAHLAQQNYEDAKRNLDDAESWARGKSAANWRITWHRGLLALAAPGITGTAAAARKHFEQVRRTWPGEVAPKLAVAFCDECLGEMKEAAECYGAVWHNDETQASAVFGLARIGLAAGDREGAVRYLDQVPALSRYYDNARIAAVLVRIGTFGSAVPPGLADVCEAFKRLEEARLERAARTRLTALVRQAALAGAIEQAWGAGGISNEVREVLGEAVTHEGRRELMEKSFRELSQQAMSSEQHDILIDLANTVRPWSPN